MSREALRGTILCCAGDGWSKETEWWRGFRRTCSPDDLWESIFRGWKARAETIKGTYAITDSITEGGIE